MRSPARRGLPRAGTTRTAGRAGPECAHDDAAAGRVRAEHVVGIGVVALRRRAPARARSAASAELRRERSGLHPQDVRLPLAGLEPHVVPAPRASRSARRRAGRDRGTSAAGRARAGRPTTPSCGVRRVEVDDHDHRVRPASAWRRQSACSFAVSRIVSVVEPLQGRVLAPDRVQPRGERQQRARPARAPGPRTSPSRGTPRCPRATGHVLAALEAGVDAVARRQRRGEDEPRLERRAAALLQVRVEDVGRVGEEVRPEGLGQSRPRSARSRTRSARPFVFRQVK